MQKEILVVMCLIFSTISYSVPITHAEQNIGTETVELTFNFSNKESGEIINSANIIVIESWSGTILDENTMSSGESILVMANHSLRFKSFVEGFEEWNSISMVYSNSETIFVNFTSMTNTYNITMDNEVNVSGGQIHLSFLNSMSINTDMNLGWIANYELPMSAGTDLLPMKSLGLSSQIDYWIGDKDETLQSSEINLFIDWLHEQAWSDSFFGGCCKIDGKFPQSEDLVKPINAWVNNELGIWGWNESTNLSVHSGFTGNRLLEIPLQNDIRQLAEMNIITNLNWEFRYSPNSDWIEGTPTHIVLNRSISGITGFIPITFATNTVPIVNVVVEGHIGLSLPFGTNITFDGSNSLDSSHNIGLGPTLGCVWEFESDNLTHQFVQMLVIVNLTDLGYLSSSMVKTTLECTDPQGLSTEWNKSWYLDSSAPNAIELVGDAECIDNPLEINILECEELVVNSSKMLQFNLSLEDDGPSNPFVFWSSNHIDGWAAEGAEMNVVFWQGQNTNLNYLMYDQQHEQRELAVWKLDLRISDEVANDWIKSWNVTVLDGSSPRINMNVVDENGEELNPSQNIGFGQEISIDLNSSYDDIHAIEDVRFVISLDGEIVADSNQIGWDGVKLISMPELGVGIHELVINATDAVGNTVEEIFLIYVDPPHIIDIVSANIFVSSGKLVDGENELEFNLVNAGKSSYNAMICIQNKCLDTNGTGATVEGYGHSNFTLIFDLNQSDNLEVNFKLTFENEIVEFNQTLNYDFEIKSEKSNLLLISLSSIIVLFVTYIVLKKKFN